MKPMKLEFVVFGISQENAEFLWKSINSVIEFLGYDTAGNVDKVEEVDDDPPVAKGHHALTFIPNEDGTISARNDWSGVDWSKDGDQSVVEWNDPSSYYSNEDEHDNDYELDEYLDTDN